MLLGSSSQSLPAHVRIPDVPELPDADETDYALLSYRLFSNYITLSFLLLFLWSMFAFFSLVIAGGTSVTALELLGLHLYSPLLCFIAILIETERSETVRETEFLHMWSVRGLFYSFIGLQTHVQCLQAESIWLTWPILKTAGSFLTTNIITIGLIYIALSLASAKEMKDRKVARYVQLMARYEMRQINEDNQNNRGFRGR